MSEGGDEPRKIKVVDRRRFDEEGELRPDRPAPVSKPATPTPPPKPGAPEPVLGDSAPDRPGGPSAASSQATSPLFMELVAGLAQQAEILIGGAQGIPAQPDEAQRLIEYLTVLESKTRGNLSTEESQVLSNAIFQLRTLFVQRSK